MRIRLAPALLASALAACTPDLPPCDEVAAHELVYLDAPSDVSDDDGVPMYAGQALVHLSCGGGAYCHSSEAEGEMRVGAPYALDFDVGPACVDRTCGASDEVLERFRRNVGYLRAHAAYLDSRVDSGSMPPGRVGSRVDSRIGGFRRAPADGVTLASGAPLPDLDQAEGRRILGTWLACGAPVVQTVRAPDATHPPGSACDPDADALGDCVTRIPADVAPIATCEASPGCPGPAGCDAPSYEALYARVFEPLCASACHGPDAPHVDEARFGDVEQTYARLLDANVDEPLVLPGNAAGSHVVHHLEGLFGYDVMPPGLASRRLPHEVLESVRAWIDAGAARACP